MMVWRLLDTGPVQPAVRSAAPSAGTFGMFLSVTTFMTHVSIGLRSATDRTTIRSRCRSLNRRLLRRARFDVRASCCAALIEFGEPPPRIRVHDVVRLPRILLRSRPAMGGNVENDA